MVLGFLSASLLEMFIALADVLVPTVCLLFHVLNIHFTFIIIIIIIFTIY